MKSHQEILREIENLKRDAEAARKREIADAAAKVRAMIAEYGLTEKDVFSGRRGGRRASLGKVPPKYRDPASGKTWTGRGKAPKWIDGKDRTQFLIR
jgi:DNA-binding protein H-NS